jgi:hypothetical protein
MRRADPERIYEAKLAGLRRRIVDGWRQSEAAADELLLEWEQEASARGINRREPAYWDQAARWIEDRLPGGRSIH